MGYMISLFLLLSTVGWAQTKASVPSKPTVDTLSDSTKSQPQPISAPGRYQIFFSPNVRADTFLVDTSTGRIWRMTRIQDEPPMRGVGFDPASLTQEMVVKGVLPNDAQTTITKLVDQKAKIADTIKAQAQTDLPTKPTVWLLEERLDSDDEVLAWAARQLQRQQRAAALGKTSPAPDH